MFSDAQPGWPHVDAEPLMGTVDPGPRGVLGIFPTRLNGRALFSGQRKLLRAGQWFTITVIEPKDRGKTERRADHDRLCHPMLCHRNVRHWCRDHIEVDWQSGS